MFIVKKRTIIITSVLVLTLFTFFFCVTAVNSSKKGYAEASMGTIVLDAGHGGIDVGVTGVKTGVKESVINLTLTKKLENLLVESGFNVVLTRKTDAGLYGFVGKNFKKRDMLKRKEIIEQAKPLLVVSLHLNNYSLSTRRGAQVFYNFNNPQSKLLAKNIQSVFNSLEESVRPLNYLSGDYYIVNCTNYPSVICECGFLSNPTEEELLISDEYQNKIAYSIFKGIISYLTEVS